MTPHLSSQQPKASESNGPIAATPEPPYYAVIFTSIRRSPAEGYGELAQAMEVLAAQQPGYLGIESVRGEDGVGVTVSYWESTEAILNWRRNLEHRAAQDAGRKNWYEDYRVRIAKVERDYGKPHARPAGAPAGPG